MIEYEENMIKELELKLANAEVIARKASVHIIHARTENEFDSFDRSTAMKNLNNLPKIQYGAIIMGTLTIISSLILFVICKNLKSELIKITEITNQ